MSPSSNPSAKYQFNLMHNTPYCKLPDGQVVKLTATFPFFILAYLADLNAPNSTKSGVIKNLGLTKGQITNALYQLRAAKNLGDFGPLLPDNTGKKDIILFNHDLIEVDAHIFHPVNNNILNAKEGSVKSLDDKVLSSLIAQYNGPFLGGLNINDNKAITQWLAERRKALRTKVARLTIQLLDLMVDQGQFAEALKRLKDLYQRDNKAINGKLAHYWVWLAAKLHKMTDCENGLTVLGLAEQNGHHDAPLSAKEWSGLLESDNFDHHLTLHLLRGEGSALGPDTSPDPRDPVALAQKIHSGAKNNGKGIIRLGGPQGGGKTHFINCTIAYLKGYKDLHITQLDLSAGQDEDTLLDQALVEWRGGRVQHSHQSTTRRYELSQYTAFGNYVVICDGWTPQSPSLEKLQKRFENVQVVVVCDTPLEPAPPACLEWPVQPMSSHEVRQFIKAVKTDDGRPLIQLGWDDHSDRWQELTDATGGLALVLELLTGVIGTRHHQNPADRFRRFCEAIKASPLEKPYPAFLAWLFGNGSLLTNSDRRVLIAASLFAAHADTIPADGLLKVVGMGQAVIDQVVACHLLKPVEDAGKRVVAYKLHRIIRDYLRDLPPTSTTSELRMKYIEYIHQRLIEAFNHPETGHALIDSMRADVVRVFDHVLANSPTYADLDMLLHLYGYFDQRGLYPDAYRLYTAALEAVNKNDEIIVYLLMNRGQTLLKQGEVKEAIADLNQARILAEGFGNRLLAQIHRDYGRVMMLNGRQQAAEDVLLSGLKVTDVEWDGTDDGAQLWLLGQHIRANLAVIYQEHGNYTQALYFLDQLVAPPDNIGQFIAARDADVIDQFKLNLLGLVESERPYGDWQKAETYFKEALDRALLLGMPERCARTRLNLGVLAYLRGQTDEALAFFAQARQDIAFAGHHELTTWLDFNEAMVALMRGDLIEADNCFMAAQERIFHLNLHHISPHVLVGSGIYELSRDKQPNAVICFNDALAAAEASTITQKPQTTARALYGLALAHIRSLPHHHLVNPNEILRCLREPAAKVMVEALTRFYKRDDIIPVVEMEQARQYYAVLLHSPRFPLTKLNEALDQLMLS